METRSSWVQPLRSTMATSVSRDMNEVIEKWEKLGFDMIEVIEKWEKLGFEPMT